MKRRDFLKTLGGLAPAMLTASIVTKSAEATMNTEGFGLTSREQMLRHARSMMDLNRLSGKIETPWKNPIDVLLGLLHEGGVSDDQIDRSSFDRARSRCVPGRGYVLNGWALWENIMICAQAADVAVLFDGKVFHCICIEQVLRWRTDSNRESANRS